ncbi:hypothetical protein [Pasteurella testudinis]|uniref:hypothetical protein n=1 Tax=Pasteurella testudinis TaxID=761 RepID=UPI00405853AF
MLKEKGYDEYLANKIKKGLEDVEHGRLHTLEECETEWQTIIQQFVKESRNFEQEIACVV